MNFPNNDSVIAFIKNILVKSISKIELRWINIHINQLTTKRAGMSANFHEDITDHDGKKIVEDGDFTGIAEQNKPLRAGNCVTHIGLLYQQNK